MDFLLADAKNVFNEINWVRMLWKVRHFWPSGDFFVFNCYRHWSSLVLWNGNGTASILHSREVMTQVDTLTIIAYGISILPLIKNLKCEIPDVTQPWYADDSGALGMFARLETYFGLLKFQGPGQGYRPKLSKNVLIVWPESIEAGKLFRRCHGFKMCTGTRYLGGCIGDDEFRSDWLRERTLRWDKNINTISKTAGKYP